MITPDKARYIVHTSRGENRQKALDLCDNKIFRESCAGRTSCYVSCFDLAMAEFCAEHMMHLGFKVKVEPEGNDKGFYVLFVDWGEEENT